MIIKDVIEATQVRLSSPYFGYALLAFAGLNWKAFFLLALTPGTPLERLAAFDGETSFTKLAIYPLIAGVLVAATSEWVKLAFNWTSSYPSKRIIDLELNSQHLRLLKTAELEKARSSLMEAREAELLRRAKQDEALTDISDDETKRRLAAQLSDYRREADKKSNQPSPLTPHAIEVLGSLAGSKSGEVRVLSYLEGDIISAGKLEVNSSDDARRFESIRDGIGLLEKRGYLAKRSQGSDSTLYTLTSSGWEQADQILATRK
ncbi:hypothetical protein [Stenotrophomonas maltophilia]|uniref:hypothetical protein n=1 Tax=Stenotrophomonas maltophilia TaxID=40324 RepID=UPI0015DFA33C|nr:hypothetical protein [Stenotrophomonas maltophilia]